MAYMRWAYDPWYVFWEASEGPPRLAIWGEAERSYSYAEIKDLRDALNEWLADIDDERAAENGK